MQPNLIMLEKFINLICAEILAACKQGFSPLRFHFVPVKSTHFEEINFIVAENRFLDA